MGSLDTPTSSATEHPAEGLDPARVERAAKAAQTGILVNAGLAFVKLLTGIVGNSYALIADAVESTADIFSSLIVWGGLRVSNRTADERFPFGYTKAEPLAGAVVGIMLVGAAAAIAVQAVREIARPHHAPSAFTLPVLLATILIKHWLAKRTERIGHEVGSAAVKADAFHHLSDAITSAAAAVGISIALIGGDRWAPADDWAALLATAIIVRNGYRTIRPAVADLMDRAAPPPVRERIARVARSIDGVRAIEKLKVRRAGMGVFVEIHVQADPEMTLHNAHGLGGRVKSALRAADPTLIGVIVHMEPFEGIDAAHADARR